MIRPNVKFFFFDEIGIYLSGPVISHIPLWNNGIEEYKNITDQKNVCFFSKEYCLVFSSSCLHYFKFSDSYPNLFFFNKILPDIVFGLQMIAVLFYFSYFEKKKKKRMSFTIFVCQHASKAQSNNNPLLSLLMPPNTKVHQ